MPSNLAPANGTHYRAPRNSAEVFPRVRDESTLQQAAEEYAGYVGGTYSLLNNASAVIRWTGVDQDGRPVDREQFLDGHLNAQHDEFAKYPWATLRLWTGDDQDRPFSHAENPQAFADHDGFKRLREFQTEGCMTGLFFAEPLYGQDSSPEAMHEWGPFPVQINWDGFDEAERPEKPWIF